ncbi:MAG TPA: AraC family ligand binding domain-containing protein, partial [Flavilitoribacter sp.]|nr:AraC family ligand binding domain-containing protein [Flavilitoribacter sp.]
MKASLYKILPNDQCSFQVNDRDQNDHYDTLHYHQEYQLSLIVEGEGDCAVGEAVDQFQKGDVFLIGPNVPHAFRTEDSRTRYRILSFFFQETGFGKDFFNLPELLPVKNMLEESARGVKIGSEYVKKLQTDLIEILELTGIMRLMKFLQALADMALHTERRILSAVVCHTSTSSSLHHRLNAIFQYISDNFDRPISLDEAAGVA